MLQGHVPDIPGDPEEETEPKRLPRRKRDKHQKQEVAVIEVDVDLPGTSDADADVSMTSSTGNIEGILDDAHPNSHTKLPPGRVSDRRKLILPPDDDDDDSNKDVHGLPHPKERSTHKKLSKRRLHAEPLISGEASMDAGDVVDDVPALFDEKASHKRSKKRKELTPIIVDLAPEAPSDDIVPDSQSEYETRGVPHYVQKQSLQLDDSDDDLFSDPAGRQNSPLGDGDDSILDVPEYHQDFTLDDEDDISDMPPLISPIDWSLTDTNGDGKTAPFVSN